MNFTDFESAWHSTHNRPTSAQLEHQKMEFIAELRRRRRGNFLFLILSGLPLVLFTILVVRHFVSPDPAHTPIDLSREWGLIPLYLLPWSGWIYIVRAHRCHCARHAHPDRSIHASVAALLDENRSERARCRFIAGLLLASLLVLPVLVLQLRAAGKAGDEIFVPFLVLFPAILLGIVGGIAVHYRRKLLPRQKELQALLASYDP